MKDETVKGLAAPAIAAVVFAVSAAGSIAPDKWGWYAIGGWAAASLLDKIAVNGSARVKRFQADSVDALRQKLNEAQGEMTVRAVTENGGFTQVDFFRGLRPDQWRKVAVSVAAARNFTYATVGQVERPKLVPMMLAAEYIIPKGQGEYDLTEKGLCWWISLAQTPYPWKNVPKKIATLSSDRIYTQYIRAREWKAV